MYTLASYFGFSCCSTCVTSQGVRAISFQYQLKTEHEDTNKPTSECLQIETNIRVYCTKVKNMRLSKVYVNVYQSLKVLWKWQYFAVLKS